MRSSCRPGFWARISGLRRTASSRGGHKVGRHGRRLWCRGRERKPSCRAVSSAASINRSPSPRRRSVRRWTSSLATSGAVGLVRGRRGVVARCRRSRLHHPGATNTTRGADQPRPAPLCGAPNTAASSSENGQHETNRARRFSTAFLQQRRSVAAISVSDGGDAMVQSARRRSSSACGRSRSVSASTRGPAGRTFTRMALRISTAAEAATTVADNGLWSFRPSRERSARSCRRFAAPRWRRVGMLAFQAFDFIDHAEERMRHVDRRGADRKNTCAISLEKSAKPCSRCCTRPTR